MAYLVELPDATKERLEEEAREAGQEPAEFIAGHFAARYGVARNAPPDEFADDIAELTRFPIAGMTFYPFDLEAMRKKHGLPPGRTRAQIADEAEKVLSEMDPTVRIEMERRGLL